MRNFLIFAFLVIVGNSARAQWLDYRPPGTPVTPDWETRPLRSCASRAEWQARSHWYLAPDAASRADGRGSNQSESRRFVLRQHLPRLQTRRCSGAARGSAVARAADEERSEG